MDVVKAREAIDYFEQEWRLNGRPYLWNASKSIELRPVMLDAARFALEVMGEGCAEWEEGVCGGRLENGLCGTHQPTEPIPLPDPNEWMKEMQ